MICPANDHDPAATLSALLEQQARRRPTATAVISGDASLTYTELNARANQVARILAGQGIGAEDTVAIQVSRSPELVIGILAILKTGACYLPIDSARSTIVRDTIMKEARPCRLVVESDLANIPATLIRDDLGNTERVRPISADNAAYVIYTSGTTARPKGVTVTHKAIINRLLWMRSEFGLGPDDRVLQNSPVDFDPSVCELFWPLAEGAAIVLARPGGQQDPAYLAHLVRAHRITSAHFVASMLPLFMDEYLVPGSQRPLRLLFSGGEALPMAVADRIHEAIPDLRFYNQYGPTEAAVDVAFWRCRPAPGTSVAPIGRPIRNTRIYLLDDRLCEVADGAVGELCIAGAPLARGYANQPGATAERFVPNPFGGPGARMYRTGDLVRRRDDGDLEFIDRLDDRVKIRGFGVALGEIEAVLASHPAIAQAAAAIQPGQIGYGRLAGYVVTVDGTTVTADHLRHHCQTSLPAHMIPASFTTLSTLPLTPNGKLDRAALPEPGTSRAQRIRDVRSPQEATLCDLFGEVLGVPPASVNDDFFALGGHSLAAASLSSRLRSVTGVDLPVSAIFESPTVAALAARVRSAAIDNRPVLKPQRRPGRIPPSAAQHRLCFAQQLSPASSAYNVPVALRLTGSLDILALRSALDDVAHRHESLRTRFPSVDGDPYQQIVEAAEIELDIPMARCSPDHLDSAMRTFASRSFDLASDMPIRGCLFTLGSLDHVLLIVIHHVATDGWSRRPFLRDLAYAYTARHQRRRPEWTELPVQYADYTLWQREILGHPDNPDSLLSRQTQYWRSALAALPGEIALPADRPRAASGGRCCDTVTTRLGGAAYDRLRAVARHSKATPYMVLQAGLAALLANLGAGEDIPIGCVVAGRTDPALDDLVGFFVNTLVLRTRVAGDPSFGELISRAAETNIAAYAHQEIPFDQVVGDLNPPRIPGRHPLFQTMLVFQDDANLLPAFPGLVATLQPVALHDAMFDLVFEFSDVGGDGDWSHDLQCLLRYDLSRFDRSTATSIADRYMRLLDRLFAEPDVRLSSQYGSV